MEYQVKTGTPLHFNEDEIDREIGGTCTQKQII